MLDFLKKIESFPLESFPFDSSETIQISSLSTLKMLRHGRAGVPIEVMGLMLGKIVDSLTVKVIDVFAMPQTGTGISVEAIDPAFQTKMLDMLAQIGNGDIIVGWYHSHPGFGCWLSGVDINTQQSFEQLNKRSVAVVIDPIQSVKGKIIIEAFRLYPPFTKGQEIRETTSVEALINNQSLQHENHGLNKYYYALNISFMKNSMEEMVFSKIYHKKLDFEYFTRKFLKTITDPFLKSYMGTIEIFLKTFFSQKFLSKKNSGVNVKMFHKISQQLEKILRKISEETLGFCINEIIWENLLR
mmetsp:Transcript_48816/g.97747  ORF Transcript_48816/g.97747 Transcript_48816/m.97747 type:complete len:300 (-) Transcript_48816:2741-3640(-)